MSTTLLPDATATAATEPTRSSWRTWCWRLVAGVTIALLATAYLPLMPVDWWWVRIGDFPRLQLLLSYLVALFLLGFFLRRRVAKVIFGLLVGGVAIQTYWIFPYLPIAPNEVEWAQAGDTGTRLRIMSANVLQENEDSTALLNLIRQTDPDIVVVCEVNQRWIDDLSELESRFPQHVLHPLENGYGIALYSRIPLEDSKVRAMVRQDIPSIDTWLTLNSETRVRLFAVHPNPPRPGEDTAKRDAELVLVGREVKSDPSVVVLGDLNDVGWSRTTNLFQEISGLLDPRKGRGFYPTFNAKSVIWRYPLDYLFHSDDFRVVELERLSDIGSDHFPLLVELVHAPDARRTQEGPDLDAGDQEDADAAVEKVRGSGGL